MRRRELLGNIVLALLSIVKADMAFHPEGEDLGVPTPVDAAQMLLEIRPVARRSRHLTRDATLARPLLAWGQAWIVGAVLYQYIPGPAGAVLASLPCAGATMISWLVRSPDVRLPAERRFAVLWFVLLASSPLLVAVAQPANARQMVVFLAGLWAVGILLYGAATQDLPLASVGAAAAAAAAAGRIIDPGAAVLIAGVSGGLAMALLGCWRLRWRR
jgi:hypothetical protein